MTTPGPQTDAPPTFVVMAAILHQGRRLHGVSTLFAALAGAGLLLAAVFGNAMGAPARIALAASLMAFFAQVYWAARVDVDARLLQALTADAPERAAARLDAAFVSLGQRTPGPGRDWPTRWRGMRALLRRQGIALALQLFACVYAWTLA
ncbi:hypothetical protein [Luteimonas sp. 3794]|uniref:hypothetical protein n=1 Tax=Luteimonas sp. 3794 TaxID=2817730 RepID=UPI00285D383E|nr:hypothetical protein [Luteimonas sp. 3794]MDR6991767.1 hypothetical protein [Luteimonas sp. 3794]